MILIYCFCSKNLIYFLYKFITNPIVGYCIGFLSSIYLIYLQFQKSTSGYRLSNIIIATKEITSKLQDKNDKYVGTLQNKYRFSLGAIIARMATTFGTKYIPKQPGYYPWLITIRRIDNPIDGNPWADRWIEFNTYVRPVIQDINSFAFLGWLPVGNRMKQLKALIKLCNKIETVVAELDAVKQIDINQKIEIIKPDSPGYTLHIDGNEQYINEYKQLIKVYGELEIAWLDWLNLVE